MSERLMAAIAFAPVTPVLQGLVARAGMYAAQQGHRTVKLEHLLFALTEDGDAVHLLETCSVDVSRLRTEIAQYLDHHDDRDPSGETYDPPPHPEVVRAIQHAAAAARGRPVGPPVVLAAIVGEGSTTAASLMSVQGFSFQAAVTALQQIAARARAQASQPQLPPAAQPAAQPPIPVQPQPQQRPAAQPAPGRHPTAPAAAAQPPQPQTAPSGGPGTIPPGAAPEDLLETARRRVEAALGAQIAPAPPVVPMPQTHVPAARPGEPPARAAGPQQVPAAPADPRSPVPLSSSAPSADRAAPPTGRPMPVAMPPQAHPPRPPYGAHPERPVPPPAAPAHHAPPPQRAALNPVPPGDYARPPAPRLEQASQRRAPPPATGTPPAPSSTQGRTSEIGRIVENVPRRARVGQPRTVEVRLRRSDIAAFSPAQTQRVNPDSRVVHAVCLRLRAPDGGFAIELLTPETAWLDAGAGALADEYATWRWRVTPAARGRSKLVLGVTVRRVGEEGLTAETVLPEQTFEVAVAANTARIAGWAGGLAAALVGGILAGMFGSTIVSGTLAAIARLGAG